MSNKPSYDEFVDAYHTIMHYIDTEPNSRKLFHALFEFRMNKMRELDEN